MRENSSPAPVVIIANRPSRKFLIVEAAIIIIIILGLGGYFLYSRYLSPKAQVLNQIDKIINLIKNPDQNLLKKYQVSASQMKTEQAIILCGGYIKGKVPNDEKQCTSDSLIGIKNTIKAGNITLAKNLITQLYNRIRNASFGDSIPERMSVDQARRLDLDRFFLSYPPDGSNPLYRGSEVKKDAAIQTMKLWDILEKKKSL